MILDLLRIDVHPARDDHEALAVGQVEEAFFINFTHIAEGRPALAVAARRGLFRIIMIFKDIFALEEDGAFLADGAFGLVVLAHDMDRSADSAAGGALVRPPSLGVP